MLRGACFDVVSEFHRVGTIQPPQFVSEEEVRRHMETVFTGVVAGTKCRPHHARWLRRCSAPVVRQRIVRNTVAATEYVRTGLVLLLAPCQRDDRIHCRVESCVEMAGDPEDVGGATGKPQHARQRVEFELALEHPVALVGKILVPTVAGGPRVERIGVGVEQHELHLRTRHVGQEAPDIGMPRMEERLELPGGVAQPHCGDVSGDDER